MPIREEPERPEPRDRRRDPDVDPVDVARTIVLDRLSQRAHTRQELADVLARRKVPQDAADQVLGRMTEVGLIDDAAFAAMWVESRQQRRHLSKRALREELRRKGVDRDEVDSALEQVDGDDERAAALALAQKKIRGMGRLEPHVRRRRLAGALARRGFGPPIVSDVLSEVLGDTAGSDGEW